MESVSAKLSVDNHFICNFAPDRCSFSTLEASCSWAIFWFRCLWCTRWRL